jgi:hypothetical protein
MTFARAGTAAAGGPGAARHRGRFRHEMRPALQGLDGWRRLRQTRRGTPARPRPWSGPRRRRTAEPRPEESARVPIDRPVA